MCGVAGLLSGERAPGPVEQIIENMAEGLRHRGPDYGGLWSDSVQGVGLSHRRLSIVDLSENGNQPMTSRNQRFVIAYNGEIYNHVNLRSQIQKERGRISWRGHSDTETIVEAVAHWGLEKTLQELIGMFAIALWDRHRQELTLARDRIGEKPLLYGFLNGNLVFGSEIRVFKEFPGATPVINPEAVASFMRIGYVPEPYSIFESIFKVPPGTFISFSKELLARSEVPRPQKYWSLIDIAEKTADNRSTESSLPDAVDELERRLSKTIEGQLLGDVPVGAFLSGGIDSSIVVALMQKISRGQVKSFSIGFEEEEFDEAPYAERVSQHLGTDHHSMVIRSEDAKAIIPRIAEVFDEPFADSSQIPTYFVSQLARESVKVSLSGDGGDEIFAGYTRYAILLSNWNRIRKLPFAVRAAITRATLLLPNKLAASLAFQMQSIIGDAQSPANVDRLHKAARLFSSKGPREMYAGLSSTLLSSPAVVQTSPLKDPFENTWPINSDLVHQMMALDMLTSLPGDLLVKVDRAAMSHGLESRMPFLDHQLIEFAWSLPLELKFSRGESKVVLRALLEKYVPSDIINRKKMGFGVPLRKWLRGPLRGWANDLLSSNSLSTSGFFDVSAVRQQWVEHTTQTRDHHFSLWNILMFQGWYEHYLNDSAQCRSK